MGLRFFRFARILIACMILPWPATAEDSVGRPQQRKQPERPRLRDLGIQIGVMPPGLQNAITDVPGVRVGHCTLRSGNNIRTGVTAILPHAGNPFRQKVPAAIVVGNGFGKLVGLSQVEELGTLETPIVLTNTLSVFTAADAIVQYVLSLPGNSDVRSINPVAGETNDGLLNDIRARAVTGDDVLQAIRAARSGPVEEGSVGAGTGTRCFGFKGGIGTASRSLPDSVGPHTIGVLVQSNFDGLLTVGGAPVGKELDRPVVEVPNTKADQDGSCMIVVATDAPLDARQLKRLARRALFGLAGTGSSMAHGSGDYVIAFSTQIAERDKSLRDEQLSPIFQAVREATEEAILNSLLRATTTTGFQGRTVPAIPVDRLVEICRHYRVIQQ